MTRTTILNAVALGGLDEVSAIELLQKRGMGYYEAKGAVTAARWEMKG